MNRISLLTLCSIGLFCALSSCNGDRDRIAGHYYSESRAYSYYAPKLEVISFLDNSTTAPQSTDAIFVDFFKNGTYVLYFHDFEYGEYTLDSNIVTLHSSDGSEWNLSFAVDSTGERASFSWHTGEYISLGRVDNSRGSKYPFTLDNNRWRIPAGEEGAPESVIERLQQHISFIEKVMVWSNKVKMPIRFQHLPGPLRVVGNGFEVKRPSDTINWCNMTGEDDCELAYQILADIFNSGNLRWRQDGNQLDRLLDVVRQIQRKLEEYKQ